MELKYTYQRSGEFFIGRLDMYPGQIVEGTGIRHRCAPSSHDEYFTKNLPKIGQAKGHAPCIAFAFRLANSIAVC